MIEDLYDDEDLLHRFLQWCATKLSAWSSLIQVNSIHTMLPKLVETIQVVYNNNNNNNIQVVAEVSHIWMHSCNISPNFSILLELWNPVWCLLFFGSNAAEFCFIFCYLNALRSLWERSLSCLGHQVCLSSLYFVKVFLSFYLWSARLPQCLFRISCLGFGQFYPIIYVFFYLFGYNMFGSGKKCPEAVLF